MTNGRPILIVDDDIDIRSVVRRTLVAHGYRTTEAGDGIAAFTSARDDPPALVVLDLGLPGQDGWAVAQQIHAEPNLESVPIVVITAYDSGPTRLSAWVAGCQDVIAKPFALATLENAISACLSDQAMLVA